MVKTEGSEQVPQKSMEEFVAEVPSTCAENKKSCLWEKGNENQGEELAGDKARR